MSEEEGLDTVELESGRRLPLPTAGLGNCLAVRPRSNWVALAGESPPQLTLLALPRPAAVGEEQCGAMPLQSLPFPPGEPP
eukprot:jgi/Tetstr1/453148/TSEL_040168.t1